MSEERIQDEKKKAIEQIRKILELARNNPNEHEAALAAEKVQTLIAKHNLTMATITGDTRVFDNFILDDACITYFSGWVKLLMNAVAKLNFCGYYFTSIDTPYARAEGLDRHARKLYVGSNSRTYLIHNFIGEDVNILGAKLLGEYLIETMEIMVKLELKKVPVSEKTSFKYSWMNACTYKLCARIAERMETTSVQETSGLPALLSMYEKARQNADAFLDSKNIKRKTKNSMTKFNHTAGWKAGYKAGEEIGLDTQVKGGAGNAARITQK